MTNPAILGPLSSLHELMDHLVASIPSDQASRQFHPDLGSLSWYLGHSVYLETYWLRQVLAGDDDLTRRVAHLFSPGTPSLAEQCGALPPIDHLRNWAAEIWDEHLLRLANPRLLPSQPPLERDRLLWFLLQEEARDYERMLMVLNQRQLRLCASSHKVASPLRPTIPRPEANEATHGHYRVGAREDPAAYDNELPPQAVELSSFRIAPWPVTNAEYLAFMELDGYRNSDWWDAPGWKWLQAHGASHPEYWLADAEGHWYSVGINGSADLSPEEPVLGLCHHEAKAYAAWAAARGLEGAVLQHEYQWEVAARMGVIHGTGRVQEWCANAFHPYPNFAPFPDTGLSERLFHEHRVSIRGASLHTRQPLRRTTCRGHMPPDKRFAFVGLRIVLPPRD